MGKKKKKNKNIWDLTPEEQQANLDEFAEFESNNSNILSLIGQEKGINDNGLTSELEAMIIRDVSSKKSKKKHKKEYDDDDYIPFNDAVKDYVDERNARKSVVVTPAVSNRTENISLNGIIPEDESIIQNANKTPTERLDDGVNIDFDHYDDNLPVPTSEVENTEVKKDYTSKTVLREGNLVNPPNDNSVDIRKFAIVADKNLGRVDIKDGIVQTTISLEIAKTEDLDNSEIEKLSGDEASEICKTLLNYIMSLKHPTAIYEYNDFYSEFWKFERVEDDTYDENKYIFYSYNNKWVFAYLIDQDAMNNFHKFIADNNSSSIGEILAIYVSMGYAAGTLNQAFFADDNSYVEKLYNDATNNKKKEFHDIFINDESTALIPANKETSNDDGVLSFDIEEVQKNGRRVISFLTGTPYADEDVEISPEDDDSEEDEESVDDFSTLMDGVEEAKAESIPNEESEMVMPVVRRNG